MEYAQKSEMARKVSTMPEKTVLRDFAYPNIGISSQTQFSGQTEVVNPHVMENLGTGVRENFYLGLTQQYFEMFFLESFARKSTISDESSSISMIKRVNMMQSGDGMEI